jgi:hypothetical protein
MTRARALCVAVAAALAGVVLVAAPAQAATVTLSGRLMFTNAGFPPAAGLIVAVAAPGSSGVLDADVADADGRYSVTAPQGEPIQLGISGTHPAGEVYTDSDAVVVSEDSDFNFFVPRPAQLQATVVEGASDAPSTGAVVRVPDQTAITSSSSNGVGIKLRFHVPPASCTTDGTGHCDVTVLHNASVPTVDVTPAGRPTESFPGFVTTDVTARTFTLSQAYPVTYPVSGTLRAAAGTALSGTTVRLEDSDGTASVTATTGPDGSYHVAAEPGWYRLSVSGILTDGSRSAAFAVRTEVFDLSAARVEDLDLPPLATLAIRVRDSLGAPVSDARVQLYGGLSQRAATAPSGLAYATTLEPSTGWQTPCAHTDGNGSCEVTVLHGGVTPTFHVVPPGGTWQQFPGPDTAQDPTSVTARLVGYASVPSSGSRPGTTLVTTYYAEADILALSTTSVVLPDGLDPIVGRLSYRVALPAGSSQTWLDFALPASANDVVSLADDGRVRDVSSAGTIAGTRLTWPVVDGSAADADGVVNGEVSGTIVPVWRASLSVETSSLPAAAAGQSYETRLTGSGPVPPYTWSTSDTLPPGLTLSPDGVISGTPSTVGTWRFDVTMRESTGSRFFAVRTLTLTVATVVVTSTSVPDAYLGGSYSTKLQRAGGGSFATWRVVSGALPPGMTLTSGGSLSGRPTSLGTYRFAVTVTSGGKTSPAQALTIMVRPMEIATASLPYATVGRWYSQALTTNGGKGTLTWSLVSGSLPPKLKLGSGGRITGTPTTPGTWTFTVRVTDSSVPKQAATRTLTITVA